MLVVSSYSTPAFGARRRALAPFCPVYFSAYIWIPLFLCGERTVRVLGGLVSVGLLPLVFTRMMHKQFHWDFLRLRGNTSMLRQLS